MSWWFVDLVKENGYINCISADVQARLVCFLLDIMNGSLIIEWNVLELFYDIFCDMPISNDAATTILQKWKHVEKIEPIIDSDTSVFDDWVIEQMMGGIWPTCYDIKASIGRLIQNYYERSFKSQNCEPNDKNDEQPMFKITCQMI
ncbi:hypothetical protein BDQ17DRAFT_1334335 [Cyathus striatus]|nr:hypothetical protein BDQ17DRAFT_1334335 [Cyathus striatus]